MPKRREPEVVIWKPAYKAEKKNEYKHSKHAKPTFHYYRSDTETSSGISDSELQTDFPWRYAWFAGLLSLIFPFCPLGITSLVLILAAYTDYISGNVELFATKMTKAKTVLIVTYFIIFLMLSLIIILIVLASFNLINLKQICGGTSILSCFNRL